MTEKDAKHAFINKCRALRTFGFLFFNVKVIDPLVPVPKAAMLGIKSGKLVLVDPNMEVLSALPKKNFFFIINFGSLIFCVMDRQSQKSSQRQICENPRRSTTFCSCDTSDR